MTVPSRPRVSVVCNTLDRADALEAMLRSLEQLTYPHVEVVVVAGPCHDHTAEVLARWGDRIKVEHCPEPNLSMSRNIGIAAAAGEIVAFIDDDGIAEPSWLDEIVALYDSDDVAGAGGVAFDHTGYTYQCRFSSVDRMGNARWDHEEPLDSAWCFPGSWEVPYVIGTNASFRRDRLVEVGGFDEEFEYYLDESDVCLRLVDAGHVIRQSEHAPVHHKFLTSRIRDPQRITLNLFPIIKNKIYFSLVNARLHTNLTDIFDDNARFARNQRLNLQHHCAAGAITPEQLAGAEATIERGWEAGIAAGFRGRARLLDALATPVTQEPFRPFPTGADRPGRRRVCLVTQSLPADDAGGISRYVSDLAGALATRGHEVRVLTGGSGHSTVDLEDGVWVHRLAPGPTVAPVLVDGPPGRIWERASDVAEEVARLNRHRPVDVVYGPLWDAEAIAVLERTAVPVVTSLVTTLAVTLELRPEWRRDVEFLRDYLTPAIATERSLLEGSHLIHALSRAIAAEVERTAGLALDPSRLAVAPLGVADRAGADDPTAEADPRRELLFVGRFEKRKGIDLLLDALPDVLRDRPDVRVVLIGRDDLAGESGEPYRDVFERRHRDAPWFSQVELRGVVDDDELWAAYRSCDVFVAPSRFESFGLIFVEAMMFAKPVIALRAGAAPEVVEHGVTGLLVDDDAGALGDAISALLDDREQRERLGRAGRRRFEQDLTLEAMGARVEQLLGTVRRIPVDDDAWSARAATTVLPDGSLGIDLGGGEVRGTFPAGGALSVALWVPAAAAAPVIVRHGAWEDKVLPARADAFRHVKVPAGDHALAAREVSVSGPTGAHLVGAVLVDVPAGGSAA